MSELYKLLLINGESAWLIVGTMRKINFCCRKFAQSNGIIMFPATVVFYVEMNRRHYFQNGILALSNGAIVFPTPVIVYVEII